MKYIFLFMLTISSLLFCNCENFTDFTEPKTFDEGQTLHIEKLVFNGSIDKFDTQTRGTTSEWEDGANLCIQYQVGTKTVYGIATYNNSSDEWTINYYGTINRDQISKCEVYYFENAIVTETDTILLNPFSAIFADNQATYYYNEGIITLKAHLRPQTSRIRFKGECGSSLRIGGVQFYDMFVIGKWELSTSNNFVDATVNSNGYTPYTYVGLKEESNSKIVINRKEGEKSYTYTAGCSSNMLQVGHSGWMTIPNYSNHNGWEKKQTSGVTDGHRWVDLELSGGTKWADQNVGANIPEYEKTGDLSYVYGNWYCWGAIEELKLGVNDSSYQENVYDSTFGIGGTSHDVAYVLWGKNWRMPSQYQGGQLDKYSKKWVTHYYGSDDAGLLLEGQTGEVLFLPAGGYYTGGHYIYKTWEEWENDLMGKTGTFWCSGTVYNSWSKQYYGQSFSCSNYLGGSISTGEWPKEWAFSVRPVIND